MKAGEGAIKIITDPRCDSFRRQAYFCPAHIPTIGFGHTKGVTAGDIYRRRTITYQQGLDFLTEDLVECEELIARQVTVPLTQNQFDALVSFTFNIKKSKFNEKDCTLLRKLNQGDYAGAAAQFQYWTNGGLGGLVYRRALEKKLFLTP